MPPIITLPQAVIFVFPLATPQWHVDAIKALQGPFWEDPTVNESTKTLIVFLDDIKKYKRLRAADFTVMCTLVNRLSKTLGLMNSYIDIEHKACQEIDLGNYDEDEEGDCDVCRLVAPQDVV
jgi:hypothetical protein